MTWDWVEFSMATRRRGERGRGTMTGEVPKTGWLADLRVQGLMVTAIEMGRIVDTGMSWNETHFCLLL